MTASVSTDCYSPGQVMRLVSRLGGGYGLVGSQTRARVHGGIQEEVET
jgi:hypothetical protein